MAKTNKILGIKGFDKNMKCLDYQYKVGEIYEDERKPVLCKCGFHYSSTIEDVFKFYPKKDGNRFCVVEILGDADFGIEKSCTNKIKIVRELTQKDFDSSITEEELSELCEYGFIIGGSIALRLQGYKITRDSSEIDLIITNSKYSNIKSEIFKGYKEIRRFSGIDSVKCYVGLLGIKYDIITTDSLKNSIVINKNGYDITLQHSDVIWEKKLQYALNGSVKHMGDIRINNISFQIKQKQKYPNRRFDIKDELPF